MGHPDDPFEKNKFESEIQNRLSKRNYPRQGWASLCGPASLFYSLQMDRPDIYEQAARELWEYGRTKIGELEIKPGDGCRHPKGSFHYTYENREYEKISGLDWVTLASLRDSENMILSYDKVDYQTSGITAWWSLSDWFEKAGYEKVFSNVGLSRCNLNDLVTLSDYCRNGYRVATLISAGMLKGYDGESSGKNHWIVWEGAVKNSQREYITNNSDLSQPVNLKLFSWGKVEPQIKNNKSLDDVTNHVFGGLVFKPLK
ncbi:hypothetical protein WDV76_02740 [Xenorhabdus griffiniae]|uniref:hypothetical protein n=1 Tax=Xenorhabdus griffiniae TaxID=351672 RepID=UPI0030D114B4